MVLTLKKQRLLQKEKRINKMTKEKNVYETPKMDITIFECEDIITTSGPEMGGGDDVID